MNMKRKSGRRSSILKASRPLEDVQNLSSVDRYIKKKRVSFAEGVGTIKEFQKELPLQASAADAISKDENAQSAQDDADTVVQISTPRGNKRRRISTDSGVKLPRLSIIPKLERSFCLTDDDFEVYEDEKSTNTLVTEEEVTMKESPVSDAFPCGEDEVGSYLNETMQPSNKTFSISPMKTAPFSSRNKTVNNSFSMDMTQSAEQHHSLLSPDFLLVGNSRLTTAASNALTDSMEISCNSEACLAGKLELTCVHENKQNTAENLTFQFGRDNSLTHSIHDTGPPGGFQHEHQLDLTCIPPAEGANVQNLNEQVEASHKSKLDLTNLVNDDHRLAPVCSSDDVAIPSGLRGDNSDISLSTQGKPNQLEHECTTAQESGSVALSSSRSSQMDAAQMDHSGAQTQSMLDVNLETCGNWLDCGSSDSGFLVDDGFSPQATNQLPTSSLATSPQLMPTPKPPSFKQRVPLNVSSLETIITNIRMNGEKDRVESTVIATPEAVPVQRNEPTKTFSGKPSLPSTPEPLASGLIGNDNNKSVVPSPSAYSKFCAFLNCDQTILDTTQVLSPALKSATEPGRTSSFSNYLEQIETRLLEISKALQDRSSDTKYYDSHEAIAPSLKILLNASLQALCAINVLKVYGALSEGLETALRNSCSAESLPEFVFLTEDFSNSLSSKLKWLSQMHVLLSEVMYPAVEEAIWNAQDVYSWTLNYWNKKTVELTLPRDHQVTFKLSPIQDLDIDVPVMKVLSVHIQSSDDDSNPCSWKTPLIQCPSTSEIAKAIYEAQKTILAQL